MKIVSKYNTCKAVSTVLTVGTPILSLLSCSELYVHRSETAISAAGVFAILLSLLFVKDKLFENFKIPSPFVISIIGLIIIVMIESIIDPLKIVFISTMVATGIDTFTFRHMYKSIEVSLPESTNGYKHFGFIFAKSDNVGE